MEPFDSNFVWGLIARDTADSIATNDDVVLQLTEDERTQIAIANSMLPPPIYNQDVGSHPN
jgi:hypothetical protein